MRNKLLLSLSSAILLSIGWLSFNGLPLLIAFVPLMFISSKYEIGRSGFWKTAGWVALSLGLWSGVTTWWIWYAAPIGAILSVLITIMMFGGVFMIYHYVSKRASMALAYTILVTGWITAEYLYTIGEVSFPWLTLGNGFAKDTNLVQWYEYTGVFGGSLWVLVCNTMAFAALKSKSRRRWIAASTAIIIPIAISLIIYYNTEQGEQKVKITVVQPNIDPYLEKFSVAQEEQTAILTSLIKNSPSDVEYIVTPETAIDDRLWEGELESSSTIEEFRALAKHDFPKTQFILGATTYRRYDTGDKVSSTARTYSTIDYWYDIYNSALAVDSSANIAVHHKSKLVVGVEKMPYMKLLSLLDFMIVDLGGISGQLGVDSERKVFISPSETRASAAICYESIYGDYFTEFAKNGAQVLFVITNDGWWRDTPGYRQHFSYSRLRAIENRRSIARSANTGISGFIDSRGDVISKIGWDVRATDTQELSLNDKITFYAIYGDYIGRICWLVFTISLLYYIAYRFRKRDHLVK